MVFIYFLKNQFKKKIFHCQMYSFYEVYPQPVNSCQASSYVDNSYPVNHQPFVNYPTNYNQYSHYPVLQNINQYASASLVSYQQSSNPSNYHPFFNQSSRINKRYSSSKKLNQSKPANYQKSCPGCDRYWKFCKCSNIKNRPDPQPYCKFVPPRMLRNKSVE